MFLQADSEGPTLMFRVVKGKAFLLSWHTNSRLPTEIIASITHHLMTDTTFVSNLRKKLNTGKMNLGEVGFHLMRLLLLKLRSQSQSITYQF